MTLPPRHVPGKRRVRTLAPAGVAAIMLLSACSPRQESGPAQRGEALAAEKGCTSCHSTDGSKSVGPTWHRLAGSRVELSNGSVVRADDEYLRESMQDPSEKTVAGFPEGVMETVIKPGSITDEQADALIAYIKTLK